MLVLEMLIKPSKSMRLLEGRGGQTSSMTGSSVSQPICLMRNKLAPRVKATYLILVGILLLSALVQAGAHVDFYKVLELQRGASEKEIKKAFRRLSAVHHPDRNGGDESAKTKFQEIGRVCFQTDNRLTRF